jgi:hypothetical protein
MKRKRDLEGYVEVDHSNSPGISAEQAASVGSRLVVPGGTIFKSATFTCSHCTRVVVLNPDRSRSRGYCRSCDHDICDRCSLMMRLGHPCQPFSKLIEKLTTEKEKLNGT